MVWVTKHPPLMQGQVGLRRVRAKLRPEWQQRDGHMEVPEEHSSQRAECLACALSCRSPIARWISWPGQTLFPFMFLLEWESFPSFSLSPSNVWGGIVVSDTLAVAALDRWPLWTSCTQATALGWAVSDFHIRVGWHLGRYWVMCALANGL